MRILLIEDSASNATLIRMALARHKEYSVVHALTGEEGLALLESEKFNMVLMDWTLPGISGLFLTQHIRGRDDLRHLPVIMITGRNSDEEVYAAIEAGANDYIIKPFKKDLLLSKIVKHAP